MIPSGESQLSLSYLSSDDRLVGVKCTSHTVDIALDWYSEFQGGRAQTQSIFFLLSKKMNENPLTESAAYWNKIILGNKSQSEHCNNSAAMHTQIDAAFSVTAASEATAKY